MGARYEDACIGCGLPCTAVCDYYGRTDVYLTCDKCGCDADKLYKVDDEELCRDCAIDTCHDDFIEYLKDESGEVEIEVYEEEQADEYLEEMYEVITDD